MMKLVSFNAYRTLNFPNCRYVKPEKMQQEKAVIQAADGVLFPEYWQINALSFAMKKRIFPSLASYLIGHNKIEMTRCFESVVPDNVPTTLIEANSEHNAESVWQKMDLPFVAKIPRASMGMGVFLIESKQDWQNYLAKTDVIYAQELLPINRDLRIVWVGKKIVASYWRIQADKGFYNNVAQGGTVMQGVLPKSAKKLVQKVALALGIDHGGFDVAMVGDHPYLFEFNRIFGNTGIENLQKTVDDEILNVITKKWAAPRHKIPKAAPVLEVIPEHFPDDLTQPVTIDALVLPSEQVS